MTSETLYNILRGGNSSARIKPDIFTNEMTVDNGTLMFDTEGYVTKTLSHSFRLYIPFSNDGNLITEYKNSRYAVYPRYRILVIDSPINTDYKSATIFGVYALDSTEYEEVYLDDDLDEVPLYAREEVATIKRLKPISLEPTKNMMDFYNELTAGNIKI